MSIQQLEAETLGSDDLLKMLQGTASNILFYDQLQKFSKLEDILEGGACIILLEIQNGTSTVGHWIAILELPDYIEHFDPYGFTVDQELAITHEKPFLSTLQTTASKKVIPSQFRYQDIKQDVNTCGRHCVVRVKNKNMNMQQYQQFMRSQPDIPDVTVTKMTKQI